MGHQDDPHHAVPRAGTDFESGLGVGHQDDPHHAVPRQGHDFGSDLDVGHQDDPQHAVSPSRERPRPHASWPAVAAHLPLSAETVEEVAPSSYA